MPPSSAAPSATPGPRLHFLEALATWFVPGVGHILLGQYARGIILWVTIMGLWLGGLLIGGIGVIDKQQHAAWFYGQAIVAPTLAVSYVRNSILAAPTPEHPSYQPSFGRPNEQGILFTALAGLLNLLVIIDALTTQRGGVANGAGQTPSPVIGDTTSPSPPATASRPAIPSIPVPRPLATPELGDAS